MRFRLQTFANNEVRLTRQSDLFKSPKMSDAAAIKKQEAIAIASQQNMYINRAIQKLYTESDENVRETISETTQLAILGSSRLINREIRVKKILPSTFLSVSETPEGRQIVTKESTQKLLDSFGRTLDIIWESQRKVCKHDSYGVRQTPKVFTAVARRRLLEAGSVIDKLGMKKTSSLLTLTLPGGTPEAKQALADWSGWVVNRQTQYLRRDKRFNDVYWFFVWEWQKRGALHQHWCVSAPTYELAQLASMALKSAWYICLDEIGFKLNIDMYLREGRRSSWKNSPDKWVWNEQQCRKSVAAYFTKYASKEYAYTKDKRESCKKKVCYPSRWFGTSKNIKEACKPYRLDVSLHMICKKSGDYARDLLLELISKYEITSSYEYQFEATGNQDKFVFASGKVEIYYISPHDFSSAVRDLDEFTYRTGDFGQIKSAFNSAVQLYKEKIDSRITQNVLGRLRYGENLVHS